MGDFAAMMGSDSMTPEQCASYCGGYRYFGVQYANECFCDNNYGAYGQATNCDMPCTGDENIMCGGEWANSVYVITEDGLDADAYVCADENEICECDGYVRYGADDTFTHWLFVEDEVECSNDVFGDPLYGTFKYCECAPAVEAGECNTVYVGGSDDNSPTIETAYAYDFCNEEALNWQDPVWEDEFAVTVDGTTITVTRLDSDSGWGQALEIECCFIGNGEDCEGQDYSGYESWVGDGYCDDGTWGLYFNCEAFDYDDGDCESVDCLGLSYSGYESWIGDGWCDDGSWGLYFNCDEFNCDEGDCEDEQCSESVCEDGDWEDHAGLTCDDWDEEHCEEHGWETFEGFCGSPLSANEACEVCQGVDSGATVTLQLEAAGTGTLDVLIEDEDSNDIAGFQFDIEGAEITGADGGLAEEAGMDISASSSRVLGFSMSGATFNADDGEVMVSVYVDAEPGAEICLVDEILTTNDFDTLASSGGDCIEYCGGGGDVNGDGSLDVLDIVLIVNEILYPELSEDDCDYAIMDGDGDGSVNVVDIVIFVNEILYA